MLALVFAIQIPAVQTGLARYAAGVLGEKIDGRVEIGSVRLHPFNAVTIKDIVVYDDHPATDTRGCGCVDTLASIGSLSATLSPRSLFRKGHGIRIDRVDASDLSFQLVIEPGNGKGGTNLTRIFHLYGSDGSAQMPLDSLFSLGRIQIKNGRYRMVNMCENPRTPKHGINFEDMDLHFDLTGHDVAFYGGRCHAVVDELQAREKCGYEILNAGGSVAVGQGHVNIKKLLLSDNAGSRLRFSRFDMNYEGNPTAWANFLNDVEIDAVATKGSHLVFHSIGNFSGDTFYGSPLALDITSMHYKGPVSNFRVSDAVLTASESGISGTFNCTFSGIPNTEDMKVDATISDLNFTTAGLTRLLADVGAKADLKKFAPGTAFTANGTVNGYLNDLKADLQLNSGLGSMEINASAQNAVRSAPIGFRVRADGDRLHLGRILGVDALGKSDFEAVASGTLGRTPDIRIDKLNIPLIEVLGYEYKDLELEGTLEGSNAVAIFRSSDPNAVFDLAANVDWRTKQGHVEAEITEFDLAATGLDRRGGKSLVSCTLSAEQGFNPGKPAIINLINVVLTDNQGSYEIGDIFAQARNREGEFSLILNSDVLDAKYNGTSDFGKLASALRNTTVNKYLPAFFDPDGAAPRDSLSTDCSLSATFHNTEGLLSFLLPGLKIGEGTALNIDAGKDGSLLGYVSAPVIEWNGISAKDLDVAASNLGGSLDCTVGAGYLQAGGFPISDLQLSTTSLDDKLGIAVNYSNAEVLEGGGELYLDALFSRDASDSLRIDLNTLPSQITIKGDEWKVGRSSIVLNQGRAFTDGLRLWCDDQSITLQGGVRPKDTDTLQVSFHELDLALVNAFTGNSLGIEGVLNGDATLVSPVSSQLGLSAGLDLSGLALSGIEAGDINLTTHWDDDAKAIALHLSSIMDGVQGLEVSGKYGMKDGAVDATAVFDGFDVGVASPFISGILPEIGGTLTGTLTAGGTTKNLKLHSDGINLNAVRIRVGYTGVAYTLDGTVGVQDNIVSFNNIGVKDDYSGMGVLMGTLNLGQFSRPVLDASLDMRTLKAIDMPFGESGIGIYGDLAITGNGSISGPFNDLGVNALVVTSGPGSVNVPISSSLAASGSDLLIFTEPESDDDSAAGAGQRAVRRSPAGRFTVHARAGIRPEVTANIEIDKDSGHVLTAGGTGNVVFDFNSAAQNKVQIKGDYNIDKGKYLLNIPGIVSKEFDIKQGSSLKFNGDPLESTLDIQAEHNVKTSLSAIVVDSTAVSTRRTVVCGLNIGGKVRSPDVSFNIDVPDLEPSTKMQVDAALSTTDKVQKQFVALLLFGTFIPEENAGVVNGSNMLYSNVGEIVAGQLNNILQKLDIPVDFGFGYQQDNVGTDIFDVAVSTQLFNNRLVVGGSVGNRKYSTSKSQGGDIVGDLDIELKLDRSGELRFKLFSHSADEYTSSLDYSQRNGFGFSYQKEYNRTADFLKQLFTPRKKWEEAGILPSGVMGRTREMKTITVE